MVINQVQARELGEALLDAAEATQTKNNQAIVILDGTAVAVPFNEDLQDLYETPVIIQV